MKHNNNLVQKGYWGKAHPIQTLKYYLLGLRYKINKMIFQLAACLAFIMASVSMVYAPDPAQVTRIEIITDTVLRNGIIVKTDTVVRTLLGPTKFVYKNPENEAAPFVPETANAAKYILKYKDAARTSMKKHGTPASISLAQGLIESRAGTSKLAVNNNNHFGMKCFSRNCKRGHCTNFTDDTHKDFFLKFRNPTESWNAHAKLLATGRYAKLKKHGRDYQKWAWGLQSAGYATDKTYATKLIAVIKRHKLWQYDK